jgi:hypothetical protein
MNGARVTFPYILIKFHRCRQQYYLFYRGGNQVLRISIFQGHKTSNINGARIQMCTLLITQPLLCTILLSCLYYINSPAIAPYFYFL